MVNIPGARSYSLPQVWGHDPLKARIKRIYKYMLKYNGKVISQKTLSNGMIQIEFEVYGLPSYKSYITKQYEILYPSKDGS